MAKHHFRVMSTERDICLDVQHESSQAHPCLVHHKFDLIHDGWWPAVVVGLHVLQFLDVLDWQAVLLGTQAQNLQTAEQTWTNKSVRKPVCKGHDLGFSLLDKPSSRLTTRMSLQKHDTVKEVFLCILLVLLQAGLPTTLSTWNTQTKNQDTQNEQG